MFVFVPNTVFLSMQLYFKIYNRCHCEFIQDNHYIEMDAKFWNCFIVTMMSTHRVSNEWSSHLKLMETRLF